MEEMSDFVANLTNYTPDKEFRFCCRVFDVFCPQLGHMGKRSRISENWGWDGVSRPFSKIREHGGSTVCWGRETIVGTQICEQLPVPQSGWTQRQRISENGGKIFSNSWKPWKAEFLATLKVLIGAIVLFSSLEFVLVKIPLPPPPQLAHLRTEIFSSTPILKASDHSNWIKWFMIGLTLQKACFNAKMGHFRHSPNPQMWDL